MHHWRPVLRTETGVGSTYWMIESLAVGSYDREHNIMNQHVDLSLSRYILYRNFNSKSEISFYSY